MVPRTALAGALCETFRPIYANLAPVPKQPPPLLTGSRSARRPCKTIFTTPLADFNDAATMERLQALHHAPPVLVVPLPPSAQPRPPEVTEEAVMRAVCRLNPNSVACSDRMSPKLLHLLAHIPISPDAGITGLSALTNLVSRLARGSPHLVPSRWPVRRHFCRCNPDRENTPDRYWASSSSACHKSPSSCRRRRLSEPPCPRKNGKRNTKQH